MPTTPFPFATEGQRDPALHAVDGAALADPLTFTFSTLPPALEDTVPAHNWPWLGAQDLITLVFNQPRKGSRERSFTSTIAIRN